jgi:hypothetical protein
MVKGRGRGRRRASNQSPRSPEDLVKIEKEHLSYEMNMARATAVGLASGLFGRSDLGNAVLESFLIHGRNLIDFFHPEGSLENDVVAEHYFADPMKWKKRRGRIPESLKRLRIRANKELAHLTYDRLRVPAEEKGWDFLQIVVDLESLFTKFREHKDM